MGRVGGDLKDHLVPTPYQLRLPRAPPNPALNTSRDGVSQFLWAA